MSVENKIIESLCLQLDHLVKLYRGLLNTVRQEKEILISAQLDELNNNNHAKEKLLLEIRAEERKREGIVRIIANEEQMVYEDLSLLKLASHFDGATGDKLRNYHSVLTLLLKRVQEHNTQNENLIQSALNNIHGAIHSIKKTTSSGSTYERKGSVKSAITKAGSFMSKEV